MAQREQKRAEWKAQMRYWCKEAETSARAAEIEAYAFRTGFRGEMLRLFPDTNPKLRFMDYLKINNKVIRL